MEDLRGLQYKPVRVLGEGSHGVVLLVEHVRLGKLFVMKLIQQRFLANKDVVGRFIAEAQRGAKLDHEAFAPIVDLGETQDGRTYFVMEYVEGVTVLQALRDRGAFALDQALVLALQLLDGLAAAHDAHLIHRDIKPANLFFTTRGRMKILDLGISKSIIDSGTGPNTAHGIAIGTPKYMSPEQAKGQTVSFATDLYAVGLVLFEMLTGEPVFDGASAQDLIRRHIYEPAPSLAERGKRPFPSELEETLACALRKDPSQRFQTAREMQRAVHSVLEATRGQPSLSSSPRSSSTSDPAVEGGVDDRTRPTVKVHQSLPPDAMPTSQYDVLESAPRADPTSTEPASSAALLGVAATEKALARPVGEATERVGATRTGIEMLPQGAATTGALESPAASTGSGLPRQQLGKRPLLRVAAVIAAFGAALATAAVIVFVVRRHGSSPAASETAVSPVTKASSVSPAESISSPGSVPPPPSVTASAPASASATPSSSATASNSATTTTAKVAAKPKSGNHYQAAVEAMNAGDLEVADEEARLAVAAGGGTPPMLLHARILEQRGKKAGAREIYRQILEKDPTMAAAVAGLKRCGG